jgi:hypothetical protein
MHLGIDWPCYYSAPIICFCAQFVTSRRRSLRTEIESTLEPSGIDILTSVRYRDWGKTLRSVWERDKKKLWDFSGFHIFPTKTMLFIRYKCNIYSPLVIVNFVHGGLKLMFRHFALQFWLYMLHSSIVGISCPWLFMLPEQSKVGKHWVRGTNISKMGIYLIWCPNYSMSLVSFWAIKKCWCQIKGNPKQI